MTEQPPGKPRVGKIVDYFNPKLTTRIGLGAGYGGRGQGPYAAMVINNIGSGLHLFVWLDTSVIDFTGVPHQDEERTADGHYWEWQTPIEKARAAKGVKEVAEAA